MLQQIVRHRSSSQMLNEDLHRGLICKRAILLIESEVIWV